MKISNPKNIQRLRIGSQFIFLTLFLFLFFLPEYGISLSEVFFWFDPLLLFINFVSTGEMLSILYLSLIPLLLTLFLGRFFCGWICPFGAINQFFSWLFRKSNKRKTGPAAGELRLKYQLLLALAVLAVLEVNLWGWLDPFSLLTRNASLLTPAFDFLSQKIHLLDSGKSIIAEFPRYAHIPWLSLTLLLFFVGANYYRKRFFCNSLCPLGALYALTARTGLFRFRVNDSCTSCGRCSKGCTYYGDPDKKFSSAECMVCYNCAVDCPSLSVETGMSLPSNKKEMPLDVNRRKVIGSIFTGTLAAAVITSTLEGKQKRRRQYLRPPGAIKEEEFIERCIRCGLCVQSCPTSFIQPSFTECGLEGLWSPVLKASAGYCLYECKKCTEVCPTDSLEKISLQAKKVFKVGTAIIDQDKCFTYADGFNCTACIDKCPTEEKALKIREVDIWNFMGRNSKVKQVYVDPDLCTGCGICEYVCPRTDLPGIYITPADEQREKITGIV